MSAFVTTRTDVSTRGRSGSTMMKIFLMIEDALERRKSRIALLEMSEEQLKDIGVSRAEAYREANRPFWL